MKKTMVLGLGSNLGNRYAYIYQAILEIEKTFGSSVISAQVYQTPPWGNTNQASFLNTVVKVSTDQDALSCFHSIKEIEQKVGRIKSERWGPRSIDIDILFYENDMVDLEDVTIPHPRIQDRSFVLIPLCDIMPEYIHPKLHKSLLELSKSVDNDCTVFN
jgi:2-amino-4-hydroxy-6-hydroxymethyldihydropteridine diphosphokinase